MIPHVSTAEKAALLVEHGKFPPLGDRGVDGSNTDGGYLVGKPVTYLEDINRETFIIAQIETPEAVANADAIAATPHLEMLLVGPGDLSVRLQCKPSIRDPKMREAVQTVAAACKKHGKAWGFPVGNAEDAKTVVDLGCQLVVHGNDFMGLHAHLEKCSSELTEVLGKR
jgi:4-hydroxy-2-oxoheptanedioate aldolase